jgi:Tfp pilus assembly protein PilX
VLVQQNGIALVLALVSIVLMSILGLYGAIGSQTDLRISHNDQLAKRTWDVADGGVRHAFRILGQATADAWSNGFSDELSNGGVGGSLGSAGGTVTTIDGRQYVFFSFGGSNATDGYYVRAEDHFDDADQTTDKDQRIRIIARGQV